MRIIVMFDLPVSTNEEKKEYRDFRKFLIKSGFLMLQESVYCKIAQNSTAAELITQSIRRNSPKSGLVQVLRITEKQFSRMEYIVGTHNSDVVDSDQRLVLI